MDVFLARQPILDIHQKVFGYELLHRSSRSGGYSAADGDLASMQLIGNTMLSFGPAKVLNGRVGLINFTRELLVSGLAHLLPADSFIVEVLESVEPDAEVIEACRELRRRGYRLALDDFVPTPELEPLISLAHIIKVDFLQTPAAVRRALVRRHAPAGILMLAEKVETAEDFAAARQEGFGYFQGYFFARPAILENKDIPPFKLNLLRLLAEVNQPECDFARLEQLLKPEVTLCYRLLRYVNSAAFTTLSAVTSIQQAMTLLGENRLRKWLTMAALPALASDKPAELVELSVLRARLCEALAVPAGLGGRSQDLFLMGLFSLLDAMIGRPLEELLDELGLPEDIQRVLLDKDSGKGGPADVYRIVLASETSDWQSLAGAAARLNIPANRVSELFVESTAWCAEVFRAQHQPEAVHS